MMTTDTNKQNEYRLEHLRSAIKSDNRILSRQREVFAKNLIGLSGTLVTAATAIGYGAYAIINGQAIGETANKLLNKATMVLIQKLRSGDPESINAVDTLTHNVSVHGSAILSHSTNAAYLAQQAISVAQLAVKVQAESSSTPPDATVHALLYSVTNGFLERAIDTAASSGDSVAAGVALITAATGLTLYLHHKGLFTDGVFWLRDSFKSISTWKDTLRGRKQELKELEAKLRTNN